MVMSLLYDTFTYVFKRCKLLLLVMMCFALAMEAKNPIGHVSIGLIVFVALLIVGYCARELCPRGPIFTSLDLDEIRLDHLDDIESSLQKNINALKNKLAYHRKKKTQVQTDRDIKRRLGERVEKFNDKGRSIYGEAWDDGDIPVKAVVAMTTKEVEELRRDAEHIVEQRKQEEKEDLWKLWNDMRQDGKQPPSGIAGPLGVSGMGGTPQKGGANSANLSNNLNSNNSRKYNYTASGSTIAESIHSMSSVTINNNLQVNNYGNTLNGNRNTLKQQQNNKIELNGNGKFASPEARPSTYSYNNQSYSYADNDAEQSQGLLKPKASPSSALRLQPPILDLSKITTAPAHIKPPPKKPPSYQPSTSPSKTINDNSANNNNNGATFTAPRTLAPTASAVDRESMRPSMRSYAPGKRPPPPAGPKPSAPNTSNTNTDSGGAVQYNPLSQQGADAGAGMGMGPSGVKSMKRPPPPMMAPPGYVPGNSTRGRGGMGARNSASANSNKDD